MSLGNWEVIWMAFKDFELIEDSIIAFFIDGLPAAFTIVNEKKDDGLIITPPTIDDLMLTLNSKPKNANDFVFAGIFSMPTIADSQRGPISQDLNFDWIYTVTAGSNESPDAKRKILFRKLSATLLLLDNCLNKQSFPFLTNGKMQVEVIPPSDVVDQTGRSKSALATGVKIKGTIKP